MLKNVEQLLNEVQGCQKCKTIIDFKKFPSASHGKMDSKYILVSEAPGKESVTEGKYWIGAGGKILRSCLEDTKKELEDIFYLTDIVKCWPNDNRENRTPTESEIINCSSYLKREIDILKPKLVLSFGKKSSEFLLNQEINMKDSHGNTYKYNDTTSILVLYHPSGIDRFMKRDIYTTQLKSLFKAIIENKIDDFEIIFNQTINVDAIKLEEDKNKDVNNTSNHFKGLSFVFPASGNEITQADISQSQLRVTADFKNHFPNNNSELKFSHSGIKYDVKFTYRGSRSHILKLGSKLMNILGLTTNSAVRITKVNPKEYLIEKIK